MSLDDLEQALFETKLGDGEQDATDVIARLLELPRAAVDRVLFTAATIRAHRKFRHLIEGAEDGSDLSHELRKAIAAQVVPGLLRAYLRIAILNSDEANVSASTLVGTDLGRICAGCPFSMECVLENLSTPRVCVERGVPYARGLTSEGRTRLDRTSCRVTPQRIRGDTVDVTCEHPKGEWTLHITDFNP